VDPFKHVQPGEKLRISAVTYNAMVDAAREHRNKQNEFTSDSFDQFRQGDLVRVLNQSGADLPRNSVLAIDAPIFLPSDSEDAFLRGIALRGVTPTSAHKGRFAILLDPAREGHIARAWVSGVCAVQVFVNDEDDDFADVASGETDFLDSGVIGAAQILWREGEEAYQPGYGYSGLQWALVRLGTGHESTTRLARTNEAIGPATRAGGELTPGEGAVTLYDWTGTKWELGTIAVTARNAMRGGEDIPDDEDVIMSPSDGGWLIIAVACPGPYE
jgi:hypothetical protein